ncbi:MULTISPECIES: sulfurtransferase [Pseudomonas]|jgi:thiosulfate/3-mercaptopyruvate sulfurtransferase|uniref:sulfurtransferase n=1 Tax=Pseudomonas TaxID=286 RepID=UPI001028B1C4|nr:MULTISPECIES: sulfurtransferase [Pseudomonas]MBH8611799.1 sulfurtransferase [Pseudomonas mohnii]MBM6447148.1 sulfurtransferase [Pseudomonas sp. MIL9]RZO05857.1 sulfurtransferase [Pseudomonas moorei]
MHKRVLVSPSELDELITREPVVLIDTRDAASYAEAHLPGAVNIHEIFTYLATTTPEGLTALNDVFIQAFAKAGLSGREVALVYEQSMTTGFGQSCRGYVLLRYLGYPRDKIKILHGGYSAWRNAGLPSTSEASVPAPATFPSTNGERSLFVNLDEMKRIVATPNIVKLDVRDVDEWIGESSSPYGKDFCPRKGRIPGSVWLEWYRMMKPTAQGPMFKSPSEILAECATVGIGPDTPVVVFCFKGARASNTFVALEEAGIRNVRLYLGSWNEWSRDLTLPIEEGLPY